MDSRIPGVTELRAQDRHESAADYSTVNQTSPRQTRGQPRPFGNTPADYSALPPAASYDGSDFAVVQQ